MKRFLLLTAATLFLLQTGCGGGGGGAGGGGGGGGGGNVTSASGTAALGIIKNGTVKIYALNENGSRGSLLGTTSTNGAGLYSQSLGSYSGPIIAYAYGSYTDEATGATVTLTEQSALRAALPSATGSVALSITGLTDLAVRKAGDDLTASAIAAANAAVTGIFKIDITGVNPIEATAAALGGTGVSAAQRDYTLALAAMSQMAATASGATSTEKLENLLNSLTQAINGSSIDPATAAAYTQALHLYLQNSQDNNPDVNTVIANSGGSPIITVGSRTAIIVVAVSTPVPLSGTEFTLNLPAGVTVHCESDGSTSNAVLGFTPSTVNSLALGKFTPASGNAQATLKTVMITGSPVSSGRILIINADVAGGATVTEDAFSITGATFVDQNNSAATGASLTVASVTVR